MNINEALYFSSDLENCDKQMNWDKIVKLIEEYWDSDYGLFKINNNILELITGGWSENEAIIEVLSRTMFWFFFWQESKRGGYYKFDLSNAKIE